MEGFLGHSVFGYYEITDNVFPMLCGDSAAQLIADDSKDLLRMSGTGIQSPLDNSPLDNSSP
jgi:hypothetical protein